MLLTTSFRSKFFGWIICRRLKVNNCRVRFAARSAASPICRAESKASSGRARERQQRRVPLDDGQDVVEIVRHAAGQLADRFHLLRLPQLCLQALPLGHITGVTMHHAIGHHGKKRPRKCTDP